MSQSTRQRLPRWMRLRPTRLLPTPWRNNWLPVLVGLFSPFVATDAAVASPITSTDTGGPLSLTVIAIHGEVLPVMPPMTVDSHPLSGVESKWIWGFSLNSSDSTQNGPGGFDMVSFESGILIHDSPEVANHMGEGMNSFSPPVVSYTAQFGTTPAQKNFSDLHSSGHKDIGYVKLTGAVADNVNLTSFTSLLSVRHAGPPQRPVKNGNDDKPEAGSTQRNGMTFDAQAGTLSFSDTEIDFANSIGDESLDPIFANDPILGATISITDFVLDSAIGNGFLFTGGTMTISKGTLTFLTADIPELLIDDEGLSPFDLNLWGALDITNIDPDSGGSEWLAEYWRYIVDNPLFPEEFMGRTEIPVTDMIGAGQSFTVSTLKAVSASVPEPAIFSLLALGGLMLIRRRR